jgi:integrase
MARDGLNISRRADGWFQASVELPKGPDGKRVRRSVVAKTLKELEAKRQQLFKEIEAGAIKVAPKAPTVGEWLDRWHEINVTSGCWKPATVRNYRDCINFYLKPVPVEGHYKLGEIRLSALTVEHVEALLKVLATEGVTGKDGPKPASTSTQKRAWSILTAALQVGEDRGLVRRNVAKQAKPPKVTYEERPVLTAQQATEIMAELKGAGDWLYPLYVLSISTGVRQGEALALRWSDVNWETSEISIEGTLDRTERTTVAPKTLQSRRTLKVGREVIEALKWQEARQIYFGTGAIGLVFTADTGSPVYDSTIRRHWADILKRLGIPPMHWHDLRHSAAILMLQAGVSGEDVAWRLGHSSINMVVRVYGWTSTKRYESAAEAMTAVLS